MTAKIYLSLIILLTAAFFGQMINFDFINLDDLYLVQTNGDWMHPLTLANLLKPVAGMYHPLTNFTFWLDTHLWGMSAGPFHMTNLFFHLVGILGIYLWLERLTESKFHALLFAALFAWHPAHVESVAWISERKDVVSVAFYFLALSAHARGRLILSLLLAFLSLLGKPFALSLPLVFLWIENWKTGFPFKKILLERSWFFAISFIMSFIAAALVLQSQMDVRAGSGLDLVSLATRLPQQILFYFSKTLVPADLKLIYSTKDLIPSLWGLLAVGLYLATTIHFARKSVPFRKDLKFGLGFFILTIAPMLKVIPFGDETPVSDRYLYVSQTGLFFPWVMAVQPKLSQVAVALTLLATCATFTLKRIPHWKNPVTLWKSHLAIDPDSADAHENLGRFYLGREKPELALQHLQRGHTAKWENKHNQAFVLMRMGQLYRANRILEEVEKLVPNDAKVLSLRGSIHLENGEFEKAEQYFTHSINAKPALLNDLVTAEAQSNMGVAAFRRKNYQSCVEWQDAALKSLPGYVYALHNRAACNYLMQKFDQAKTDYEMIIKIDPAFAMAYNGLGAIALRDSQWDIAESYFKQALAADPNSKVVMNNLAEVARLRATGTSPEP